MIRTRIVAECDPQDFNAQLNRELIDLQDDGFTIIDIKFSTCVDKEDLYFDAIIMYELEEADEDTTV